MLSSRDVEMCTVQGAGGAGLRIVHTVNWPWYGLAPRDLDNSKDINIVKIQSRINFYKMDF